MHECIDSIGRIGPGYPVKPVPPVKKDTDSDEQKRHRKNDKPRDDDDDKPLIDERV